MGKQLLDFGDIGLIFKVTLALCQILLCLQSILVLNQCMDFDQNAKTHYWIRGKSDKLLVTLTQFSLGHTNRLQCLGVPHLISKISSKDKYGWGT